MPINWATEVYFPAHSLLARPVTITPLASQPNAGAYGARGIYNTEPIDILAEEGAIFSDTRTILDILEMDFPIRPIQGDLVSIPATGSIVEVGDFVVIDVKSNGGGETTLALRKLVDTKP
jgi:hypothetical protein